MTSISNTCSFFFYNNFTTLILESKPNPIKKYATIFGREQIKNAMLHQMVI